jgi:hypothetical protein
MCRRSPAPDLVRSGWRFADQDMCHFKKFGSVPRFNRTGENSNGGQLVSGVSPKPPARAAFFFSIAGIGLQSNLRG